MKPDTGKIWLVGAGPGDPGLLTQKGRAVLAAAEVVVYDRLAGPGVLALIPPEAEAVDVGKRAGCHPVPQKEINRLLCEKAREGRRVVRLKGGDPFVFGRGGEELALASESGIPFEVVPGVTSAAAVPACAGIPVTHRGLAASFHVITGHTRTGEGPPVDYPALAALEGTLVFLMGVSSMGAIAAGLLAAGMRPDMPAAVVQSGATARQRRVLSTLRELEADARAAGIGSPAVIVVGEVCALSEALSWAEKRPLAGVRALVRLAGEDGAGLAEKLAALGAETAAPTVLYWRPPEDPAPLREALARLSAYRWLLFDRPASVRGFFEALLAAGLDVRALAGREIAAVSPAAGRALLAYGIRAGDAGALRGKGLLLCAENLPPAAPAEIEAERVSVCRAVFRESCPFSIADFLAGEEDLAAFSCREAAEGFFRLAGELPLAGKHALCAGEEEAALARAAGMQVRMLSGFLKEKSAV